MARDYVKCYRSSINIIEIWVYRRRCALCLLFPTLLNYVILQICLKKKPLEYSGTKIQFKITAQMLKPSWALGNLWIKARFRVPCGFQGLRPMECGRGQWPHHKPIAFAVHTCVDKQRGCPIQGPHWGNAPLLFIYSGGSFFSLPITTKPVFFPQTFSRITIINLTYGISSKFARNKFERIYSPNLRGKPSRIFWSIF